MLKAVGALVLHLDGIELARDEDVPIVANFFDNGRDGAMVHKKRRCPTRPLPPEIDLKKEIMKTEDLLAGMEECAEKYKIMKKLNVLIMKFNACRNSSIEFEMPEKYMAGLVERFGPSKGK